MLTNKSFVLVLTLILPLLISADNCRTTEFQCSKSVGKVECVSLWNLCNTQCDCLDCSDETSICETGVTTPISGGGVLSSRQAPCSHVLTNSSYGVISSPGFPRLYPPGTQCSWLLQLGRYDRLEIRQESLLLPRGDTLIIYDGPSTTNRVLGQFWSEMSFSHLVSSFGTVLIVLQTQPVSPWLLSSYHPKGFNLTYQIKGVCIPGLQMSCEGEPICFDLRYDRCTGVWQCPLAGTDELACPPCKTDEYYCRYAHKCYSLHQRCDGKNDCPHMRDELHCDAVRCGPHNATFLCTTGQCIFESWVCDGNKDCIDASDEMSCPSKPTSPRVILAAVVGSLLCGLIVVLSIAYVCKVHAIRSVRQAARLYQLEAPPMEGLLDREFRCRPFPPSYDESVRPSCYTHQACSPDSQVLSLAVHRSRVGRVLRVFRSRTSRGPPSVRPASPPPPYIDPNASGNTTTVAPSTSQGSDDYEDVPLLSALDDDSPVSKLPTPPPQDNDVPMLNPGMAEEGYYSLLIDASPPSFRSTPPPADEQHEETDPEMESVDV